MTSANIFDVSVSVNAPVNPYKSNKSQDSAKEDFMSMMAGSMQGVQNAENNVKAVDVSTATETKVSDDSSFNSTKERITVKEETGVDSKEVKESIDEFEASAVEKIKEELGVTDEEIEAAMEELGLSFVDLTQPTNLAVLLKDLMGTEDSTSLLLDESVSEIFDAFSEFTGELFEETGLDTEGLKLLSMMEPVSEETVVPDEIVIPEETKAQVETADIKTEVAAGELKAVDEVVTNVDEPEQTEESDVVNALNSKMTNASDSSDNKSGANTSQNNSNSQPTMTTTTPIAEPTPVDAGPVNDFNNTLEAVDNAPEVIGYTSIDTSDLIDQIVTQARTSITEQVRSMELELNPQHLGRLLMQVSETEGQVTARFFTQNESVKSALESTIVNLIEKLNEQGVKVESVEVSVGTHEFEENLEQNFAREQREDLNESGESKKDNRSRGGIHLGDPDYMEGAELSEEEELTASMMRTYGNTVNFRA